MRTFKFLSFLIFASLIVVSCEKDPTIPQKQTINSLLADKAPAINSFTIASASNATITNDSISVTFNANSFADENGNPYNGTVTIKMQTIRNIAGMIYSGVTTTSNGEMLISDGMFRLEAYGNSNKPLKLKNGSSISVNLLADEFDPDSEVFIGTIRNDSENEVEWSLWPDSTAVGQSALGTTISGIDKLFTWCNLDQLMNGTPLTNITVTVPAGFSSANTQCFFKYSGENAGAYLSPNPTLRAFSTEGSYYKVIQGREAKILVMAVKDEKTYYQTVSTGAITANQVIDIASLIETSEENLHAVIAAFRKRIINFFSK
jgi:hypothetical protein